MNRAAMNKGAQRMAELLQQNAIGRRSLALRATLILSAVTVALAFARPVDGGPLTIGEPDVTALSDNADSSALRLAYAKYRARDITACLELLRQAVEENPELPPAELILAQLHFQNKQLSLGRGAVEQAIVEHPEHPDCYLMLADLAFREGRVAEASLCYERALKLIEDFEAEPDLLKKLRLRALAGQINVYQGWKRWEEMLATIDSYLELDPENFDAVYRRGVALFKTGKAKEAFEVLQQAAELSDELLPAAITLGRLYQEEGNREKAIEWMTFAASRGSTDARVRREVARWMWETEQFADARTHAEAAVTLDPEDADAKLMLGIILRYLREYSAAEKQLEQAYLLAPGRFDASNQLALVLVDQDERRKQQRALELARVNAARFDQDDARYYTAHATLGWIQYRLQDLNNAERNVRISGGTKAITSDMAYFMACISSERERYEEAKSLLKRALDTPGPFAYRPEAQELFELLEARAQR